MENEIKKDIEEIKVSTKFNPATQKYEPDLEELDNKIKELNNPSPKENKEKPKGKSGNSPMNPGILKNKNAKEGSFKPIIFIMLISLAIAGLWDKVPKGCIENNTCILKNSVHFVLDPSAGGLLNWNLIIGMLIIVLIITIITTIVQKYATDQKTLKELKKESKEIQKQMKEFKSHPEKLMELQKKQFAMMPKQMKLSMRAIAYTGVPFILFFRWFNDYFISIGSPKFFGFLSWFLFYLIFAMIFSYILRKRMDVV